MELSIRLYSDKPSRIGIRYIYEYQAVKTYEELISRHAGQPFEMKLEPVKNQRINLQLRSVQTGKTILYRDLDYRPEQVMRLQAFYQRHMPLDFVHVFPKNNTLFIAKPFRRAEFLRLVSCEVVGYGTMGST